MLAERLHCCFRIGDGIAPAARGGADKGSHCVGVRLQESGVRQEGVAVHVETVVRVVDDGNIVDCDPQPLLEALPAVERAGIAMGAAIASDVTPVAWPRAPGDLPDPPDPPAEPIG